MDRYDTLKIFVKVAELQSFTKAAESLGLPKATVSNSIQSLETRLNIKLLHRTTRQVQLTVEGTVFFERSKDLLSDFEDAESMFQGENVEVSGKVRVDMAVPMARGMFLPLLPEFLALHPKIEIELSSTDRRVDLIREGIDCVIRASSHSEPGLIERELGSLTLINCVSPGYIKKYGKPKSIDDLKNHRLIHYVQTLGNRPEGFEYFDGEKYREVKMQSSITVNSTDSYLAASLAGLGICQNPLHSVRPFLESGELVEILPKFRAEPMKIKMVFVQRRLMAKRVRVFMDWFAPRFAERIR